MIEYKERQDGPHLYACIDLADGCYMEVPIHNVDASDIQQKLQEEIAAHHYMMAALSPDP